MHNECDRVREVLLRKQNGFLGAAPLAAQATRYEWKKQVKSSSRSAFCPLPSALFLERGLIRLANVMIRHRRYGNERANCVQLSSLSLDWTLVPTTSHQE
jgi:hypothetical protein